MPSLPLREGAGSPQSADPHGVLRREWGHRIFLAARPFGSPGAVEGAFAASAARRAPCGPPGAPCVQSCIGNLARGGSARPAPSARTLSTRQEHAVWLPVCRARWRGRERRGQCLLLLTKGSRSSSPAERPAVLHPASGSRHRCAQRRRGVPVSLAACSRRGAGSRKLEARGHGGWGRCRRECSRARRLQSLSSQLGNCRTREQQVAEDSESSAPACRAPGPRWGHRAAPRAPLSSSCAFCLHARGHSVT